MLFRFYKVATSFLLWGTMCVRPIFAQNKIVVWVNNGEDKVAQEELRLSVEKRDVRNCLWDGDNVRLLAARNETISTNLVLEAATEDVSGLTVRLQKLVGPGGVEISSRQATSADLFDYRGRNIELFYVRYLKIMGCSILNYEHYDERHVPKRFRRPHDDNGTANGGWSDRPDHDRSYPDIAVPLELHWPFDIAKGTSQAIWIDIYVPMNTPPGMYQGEIIIEEASQVIRQIPVQLRVLPFSLPELPTCRTMIYVSDEDINQRYEGMPYMDDAPLANAKHSRLIMNRHFQMAHRHRTSLIQNHTPIERMDAVWQDRLSGSLFTPEHGYEGIGVGVGNNVFSIGTYGLWPWKEGGKDAMQRNADSWVSYFDSKQFATPTDYFLYLIDESDAYSEIESWSRWIQDSTGPGHRLKSLATLSAPNALAHTPSLLIPMSTLNLGMTSQWQTAVSHFQKSVGKDFYMYNGARPASGCLAIEEDGVGVRMLPWCQFKFSVSRWFIWSGTYYNNFQGGMGQTKLFSSAHTFGSKGSRSDSLGETGWNYNNGDGILFYPGADKVYPEESYNVDGPIASLRLKHWRRGIQDYEYLQLASRVDPVKAGEIVKRMIPRVLWEVDVDDVSDPTWARTDISWSTNPDHWEAARAQLAQIIMQSGSDTK